MRAQNSMNIKNLSDFVQKASYGRSICGVLVKHDRVVATDSFKLIEHRLETGLAENEEIIVALPKGVKTFDKVERVGKGADMTFKGAVHKINATIDEQYPSYEQVIPKEKPIASVQINPAYLQDIAEAFAGIMKGKEFNGVTVEFHGETKPLVFKIDGTLALLMPINK